MRVEVIPGLYQNKTTKRHVHVIGDFDSAGDGCACDTIVPVVDAQTKERDIWPLLDFISCYKLVQPKNYFNR